MTIHLRDITRDNYRPIGKLKVAENQLTFVATNPWSMTQAHYEPGLTPLGIYDDDTPVGFMMFEDGFSDANIPEWSIWRVMIDARYQGRGYGRAAMKLLLARLRRESRGHQEILISFAPENVAAKALYVSLGFEDTGTLDEGELVYRLRVED
jgi:diamine N-acetyltransferase